MWRVLSRMRFTRSGEGWEVGFPTSLVSLHASMGIQTDLQDCPLLLKITLWGSLSCECVTGLGLSSKLQWESGDSYLSLSVRCMTLILHHADKRRDAFWLLAVRYPVTLHGHVLTCFIFLISCMHVPIIYICEPLFFVLEATSSDHPSISPF